MLRAGTAAAAVILRDYSHALSRGVALFAGHGNNGGDAYIAAAQLARAGVSVRLHASAPPRTDDAIRAAALSAPYRTAGAPDGTEHLVVDGLLGTGYRGPLRDGVADAIGVLRQARARGATIVALDVPSGLDATTGDIAEASVAATVTLCFGSVKRGVLFQRGHVGRVLTLDIGLRGPLEPEDGAWYLADSSRVAATLPMLPWNAHKGTRGAVALVGGGGGMAGALVLAARAALASGAGLVRAFAERDSVPALQGAVPQAIAMPWPTDDADMRTEHGEGEGNVAAWGTALAIGPGLGRGPSASRTLARALQCNGRRPIVLDADALALLAMVGDPHSGARAGARVVAELTRWTANNPHVLLTPHPKEFARLLHRELPAAWDDKVAALQALAAGSGATILLKGTPTLVATPDGAPPVVVAHGTALLATGGSGDVLTGIIGALLANGVNAPRAAALGATAHGVAAEVASAHAGGVRGLTLAAVLDALPDAWRRMAHPATLHRDVLSEFPSPVI